MSGRRDCRSTPAPEKRRHTLEPIELATVLHLAVFVIATTWGFGGQSSWLRSPLLAWGSLGFIITLASALRRWRHGKSATGPLWWMLPILCFDALVLLAASNPSFREVHSGADVMLVRGAERLGWPSSARPEAARDALWLFNAVWFSCYNIIIVIHRRRAVRALLMVVAANAAILAVFGTLQKLSHSPGIFFGKVPTPQKYFFASFVYHNHWGSFALLATGCALGLIWHIVRRRESRNIFHSPAMLGCLAVLLIAATVPLSGSRSTTVLMVLFGLGAFLHWIVRLVKQRRHFHESTVLPLIGGSVVAALAIGSIGFVAKESIQARLALTEQQVAEIRARGNVGSRAMLYGNTWRMARDKIWFGWGMGSYPHVFMLYNTQESVDRFPVFYHDAHSDWLQSLAEHGVIGSALIALCALTPLASLRRRVAMGPISGYLLTSCAILLLYAWVEFPFGNFAVVLCWWLCFFSAVQYARLSTRDNTADEGVSAGLAHE